MTRREGTRRKGQGGKGQGGRRDKREVVTGQRGRGAEGDHSRRLECVHDFSGRFGHRLLCALGDVEKTHNPAPRGPQAAMARPAFVHHGPRMADVVLAEDLLSVGELCTLRKASKSCTGCDGHGEIGVDDRKHFGLTRDASNMLPELDRGGKAVEKHPRPREEEVSNTAVGKTKWLCCVMQSS